MMLDGPKLKLRAKEVDLIKFKVSGGFDKTEKFLKRARDFDYQAILVRYAGEGLSALKAATPKDSGETSAAWSYQIERKRGGHQIVWTNDHIHDGIPVVILLQYGHGTRGGTYVEGIDFINPAMKPIFEKIAENLWKEVASL